MSAGRIAAGAVAGFIATLPMTWLMRRAHARLPAPERYPATPREIVERASRKAGLTPSEPALRDLTLVAHYAYGAAAGAAIAALDRRGGGVAGVAVWTASYFGWIPAARLLKTPLGHPARRNAMMIGAHFVWGAATALLIGELERQRAQLFRGGRLKDAA